jgi:hypothetical protein
MLRFTEFRKDGFPLCPSCGEDELYSGVMLHWNGEGERPSIERLLQGGFGCYLCHWTNNLDSLLFEKMFSIAQPSSRYAMSEHSTLSPRELRR